MLAYDDGCHLKKFLINRHKEGSAFAGWLLQLMHIIVDKYAARPCLAHPARTTPPPSPLPRMFHWPNHKNNTFCKANVNPANCPHLTDGMNTEAAEEARRLRPCPLRPCPPVRESTELPCCCAPVVSELCVARALQAPVPAHE